MTKRFLLILILCLSLPVFAEYNPLSNEPITSPEEFYNDEKVESPEFEYPSEKAAESTEAGDISEVSEFNEFDEDFASEMDSQSEEIVFKPSKNYSQIYNSLEVPTFKYMHGIDPDQYYDIKDTTWSPYPLLRLNSYIYFKSIAIEPGYYLLTPREYKGKWYLLFKQNGTVSHIIPIYERSMVPEGFYDKHLSKPKLTPSQKIHMKTLSLIGKVKSSKRRDPIKSYMEINDLENYFVSIIIYYGNHKYSTLFRTIRL